MTAGADIAGAAVAGDDDAALIAAEQQLVPLLAQVRRIYALYGAGCPECGAECRFGADCQFDVETLDPIYQQIDELEDKIRDTPAAGLTGAAVKLRQLLGVDGGEVGRRRFDASLAEGDLASLVHVLAVVEAAAARTSGDTRAEEGERKMSKLEGWWFIKFDDEEHTYSYGQVVAALSDGWYLIGYDDGPLLHVVKHLTELAPDTHFYETQALRDQAIAKLEAKQDATPVIRLHRGSDPPPGAKG